MSLSSIQLDAFIAVAKHKNFSNAAKELHITQSALSQRVLNLEGELGATLLIREPAGVRLTELGQRLLRYGQAKSSLESEFIGSLKGKDAKQPHGLAGIIQVAGFSTVMRSVLIPSLSPLVIQNPDLRVEFFTQEIRDLPGSLESGAAAYILLDRPLEKQGVENVSLGWEEYVMVQAKAVPCPDDFFLDHDATDTTTEAFLKIQTRVTKTWQRSYLDEIYAIIDGVLAGMGRAVIPHHIARTIPGLEVVKGQKSLKTPVYLTYYRQAFYTALQKRVIQEISDRAPRTLASK